MIENFDYSESEAEWMRIENELKNRKKSKPKKVVYENPLQEKYQELFTRYGNEFGHNDGSIECERLLDDLHAFERVFHVMGWNKYPKK